MQKRLRKAYTALKEHSYMSYAKLARIGGFCDLDLIVIKATSPDDLPLQEKYIYELLNIFTFSPSSFRAFFLSFTRRFGKTQCWRVALKCLLLLHRLLRCLPSTSPFKYNLLWSRSNGLISLYPCRFRDCSSSNSENYTVFIQSYSHLLDEALNFFTLDRNDFNEQENDEQSESFSEKMKEVGRVLEFLPQIQSLIEKVLECNPNGPVIKSLLVRAAMKLILRDSFLCYVSYHRDMVFLLDNLFQMQYRCCISALGIYKRAAVQESRLSEFYDSCKERGLCGSYEYPFVDQIPQINVQAMEDFLQGMWRLTESSNSSSETNLPPSSSSPFMSTEDDEGDKKLLLGKPLMETVICTTEWERFEEEDEEIKQPLLQLEMISNWEILLEASVLGTPVSWPRHGDIFCGLSYGHGRPRSYDYKLDDSDECEYENSGSKMMQVYNPYSSNPFYY